jgi:hypothetical protein
MPHFTKLKIFVLTIFFIANAIFVSYYINTKNSSAEIKSDVMKSVQNVLSTKKITVSATEFPALPTALPLYLATNSLASKESIDELLLGSESVMLEPNYFQNSTGNLFVNGGKFDLYTISITNEMLDSFAFPSPIIAKNTAKKALKNLNLWSKFAKTTTITTDPEFKSIVTVSDFIQKQPVLDSYIQVGIGVDEKRNSISKSLVTKISGRNWLNTTYAELPDSYQKILTLDTLLIKFAANQSNPMDISQINFGYYLGDREQQIKTLTTKLAICITANIGTFYVDAVTGQTL